MTYPAPAPMPRFAVPRIDALAISVRGSAIVTAEGEIMELGLAEAARRFSAGPVLLCHRASVRRAFEAGGTRPDIAAAYDLLELFAFARPAAFSLPTIPGLAAALGLAPPADLIGQALILGQGMRLLLAELAAPGYPDAEAARGIATTMGRAGWPWAGAVLAALGGEGKSGPSGGLDVWSRLPEWEEPPPAPPADDRPVAAEESRQRLHALLGQGAEVRAGQSDYAARAAAAFSPRAGESRPNVLLAEAGTGIGKTLGYIAPASLWAERNGGAVWISTYTKNLQRQVDQELDRLYSDPALKARRAVIRKGRENYLCLLNFEEAVGAGPEAGAAVRGAEVTALGLIARWAGASRDGDMVGGDFPAWLRGLYGQGRIQNVTDRRGECIYSACPHYRKCFIERAIRRARRAEIVVANHALVMYQAALGDAERDRPGRIVFDEGHHLFDAADGAFSAHLTGAEAAELRRWVRGPEGGGRQRGRGRTHGLSRRVGDLLGDDGAARDALDEALRAAESLPGPGWPGRLRAGAARGAAEGFLATVREQVLARAQGVSGPYSLECGTGEPIPGLTDAARRLEAALHDLARPLLALARALRARLDDEAAKLDSQTRNRMDAAIRGLDRRGSMTLGAWRAMLQELGRETPQSFVDFFSVDRTDGREYDVGMHRHWIDPTEPLAETVFEPAHGVLVTSATLRDHVAPGDGDGDTDWRSAEIRTGAHHLVAPPARVSIPSPFDYPGRTRVIIVTDVRRTDMDQVAAAYRELFLAAGGGALGLFTAIQRLRGVHARIARRLDVAGLALYAQHVDPMDTATLVDIFRAEADSCLLGTDAVRDGVDVPGRALRLIVFDRVPWPRPDILHRARKARFGGAAYDDMITRLRLKQAYGRLLRREGDRGVFVMLDRMMPSRLLSAFPEGVEVVRTGLAGAADMVRGFLAAEA